MPKKKRAVGLGLEEYIQIQQNTVCRGKRHDHLEGQRCVFFVFAGQIKRVYVWSEFFSFAGNEVLLSNFTKILHVNYISKWNGLEALSSAGQIESFLRTDEDFQTEKIFSDKTDNW